MQSMQPSKMLYPAYSSLSSLPEIFATQLPWKIVHEDCIANSQFHEHEPCTVRAVQVLWRALEGCHPAW